MLKREPMVFFDPRVWPEPIYLKDILIDVALLGVTLVTVYVLFFAVALVTGAM